MRIPCTVTEMPELPKLACNLPTAHYYASTQMECDTFAFVWSLKNFSSLVNEEEIWSPTFMDPTTNHVWDVRVEPRINMTLQYDDENPPRSFCVLLRPCELFGFDLNEPSTTFFKCSHQVSILGANDKPVIQTGSPSMFETFQRMAGTTRLNMILTDELLDPSRGLVIDDTVKLHFQVWIPRIRHRITSGFCGRQTFQDDSLHRFKTFGKDLWNALETCGFTDVSIHTKTKTIPTHKFILSCRSPVFRAMFQSSMTEPTQNLVEIPDFDAEVVQKMLEYMYTGEVTGLEEHATDILPIADKYELIGLVEDCVDVLGDSINIESATNILILAHFHNHEILKYKVFNFINRNKAIVCGTENFKEFARSYPELLIQLYCSSQ